MKVFMAFAFHPQDKELVGHVDQLLASHHVQPVTGEGLGGEQLNPAVQARIDKCDALVALATQRDAKQSGGFTTHQWVLDELGYARNQKKQAIAVIENGVDVGGMYQPHEYIPLDRAQPLPAILRLSEAIGLWRQQKGRTVKVQIMPSALATTLGGWANGVHCAYRLWLQGKYSDWIAVTPVPEGGGAFVWVEGVQEEHLIQVQITNKGKVWISPATSQWMQVALKVGGGK
jgi:hypothetical protein